MSQVRVRDLVPDRMPGDVVAAFFFKDQRPLGGSAGLLDWRLNGALTRLIIDGKASGNPGEFILVRGNGKVAAPWILFAGGGAEDELALFTYSGLIGGVMEHCRRAGFRKISLCLSESLEEDRGWLLDVARDLTGTDPEEEIYLTVKENPG